MHALANVTISAPNPVDTLATGVLAAEQKVAIENPAQEINIKNILFTTTSIDSTNGIRIYSLWGSAVFVPAPTLNRTRLNPTWFFELVRDKNSIAAVNPDMTNHHVCLSRQALALLRDLHTITGRSKHLFPNQRDHKKPISNNTILVALGRMGYEGKMTGHGLRALAMSTIKERLGYRHEVVDRQLAHAPKDKVASAYDRAQFLAERR